MDKWNKLPEWARWILCWPFTVILTLLAGLVTTWFASLALDRIWISKSVAEAVYPALATFMTGPVFFFFIHLFVPRKQNWITGFFVFLSTALGVGAVVSWYLLITRLSVPISELAQEILQTITAVGVSWFWFFYFKNRFISSRWA